jgi:hypothetical protein
MLLIFMFMATLSVLMVTIKNGKRENIVYELLIFLVMLNMLHVVEFKVK